ncbi:chymotrypsin-elastase inhibitor ixodidin-like [Armigeres subalbatus]|uniref:chymotrypsin-elastase inhibitor ixodidin-like n=1 Tax=Armigeres subalbatus TaxID=124917 RepID=UPI002ED04B1C
MKNTAALLLLGALVTAVLASPIDTDPCGPDRIFNKCGSACPTSCGTLGAIITCPPVCVEGCFCRPGLVLDGDYNCIAMSECSEIPAL